MLLSIKMTNSETYSGNSHQSVRITIKNVCHNNIDSGLKKNLDNLNGEFNCGTSILWKIMDL